MNANSDYQLLISLKRVGGFVLLLILSFSWMLAAKISWAQSDAGDSQASQCEVDKQAMLTLDFRAFDQDFDGGWRLLSKREGCELAAAELIRNYREHHNSTRKILFWHEGQMRANIGEHEQAIKLFELTWNDPNDDVIGWNHYVQASIAFLKRDKPALIQAREELAQKPRPDDFEPTDSKGNAVEVEWPWNLKVVDRLIECFDYSYKQAYSGCGG